MKNRIAFKIVVILCLLLTLLPATVRPARAQAGTAGELIAAVNAYRANYGLAAYTVDGSLMSLAQQHSEYQASIGQITHTRADGSTPATLGITSENVGGGPGTSINTLINSQWTDYWHTHTLVGYSEANVGAGVAFSGNNVYYTLIVVRTGSLTNMMETISAGSASSAVSTPQPGSVPAGASTSKTQVTATPFVTGTPRDDGAIVHVVSPGETLWSISMAYGITEQHLKDINGFTEENPVIFEGNRLFIVLPYTRTPTATITGTPLPPTQTPLPSRTPRALLSTPTAGTALAPTAVPLLPPIVEDGQLDRKAIGFWVLLICLIGLVAAFVSSVRKR